MSTALDTSAATLRNVRPQGFLTGIAMLLDASTAAGAKTLTWGTGAPNHTAPQGSVYIRLDASDSDLVFYRNTDGATTWETVVGSELTDLLAAANSWTGAQTFAATKLLTDEIVKATVTVGNATGGSTDAALTLALKRADNATAIASARQVLIKAGSAQYQPEAVIEASLTFVTATVGSIVASGAGWALVETDATGAFACTARNTEDETLYFAAYTPPAGVSDLAKACLVLGSNSDAAAWSA